MTSLFQEAETPAGKPVATPIPVAPVVVKVTGVSTVLIQSVGVEDGGLTVLSIMRDVCKRVKALIFEEELSPSPCTVETMDTKKASSRSSKGCFLLRLLVPLCRVKHEIIPG